jgi:site-specific recombinase XerD
MRREAKRFINHIKTERGLSRETVESYQDDLKKFIEFVEGKKGRGLLPGDVSSEVI